MPSGSGLTTCRRFTNWYRHNPGPGVFKLDELEDELETAARHGVAEWLCIYDPPAFAQPGKITSISYRAFDFREDVWREFVATATRRLQGKFIGWEWLNEITPGGCDDPVATYLAMCRIGAETAKQIDPDLVSILAGGLYPRSFRLDMLKAGVGPYIDALPVHYQNGSGVAEARSDLNAAGLANVAVWEDESGRARNAWAVPPLEEIQGTNQADWVLRQWPDELAAGCQRIIYFGGRGDAAGSWDYLLDDLSPRPVAATLAVLTSKLFNAKPQGTFMLGRGGLVHLFERDGRPVLVVSTYEADGEIIQLHAGSESLTVTDYQGNEQSVACTAGVAELALAGLPVFVEGADLDCLKAYVVPEILVTQVAAGNVGQRGDGPPGHPATHRPARSGTGIAGATSKPLRRTAHRTRRSPPAQGLAAPRAPGLHPSAGIGPDGASRLAGSRRNRSRRLSGRAPFPVRRQTIACCGQAGRSFGYLARDAGQPCQQRRF